MREIEYNQIVVLVLSDINTLLCNAEPVTIAVCIPVSESAEYNKCRKEFYNDFWVNIYLANILVINFIQKYIIS